jgi:hypothetical protein
MAPKFLYSASLETHMADYMKNVDLQNQNNQYQLAQAEIIREGEAMQLSQAEIMNKIAQMQESIKDNIASKLIPKSQTDVPEPMKPTVKVENRRGLQKLKEKLQKRKQTQMITEVFPEVNKQDVNKLLDNVLSDIIKKGIKKQDTLKIAEYVIDDISKQSSRQNITKEYVDNTINKALGSTSSQATTASSSTTTASNIEDIKQKPGAWAQEKSLFRRSEKFKTLPPAIQAELSSKNLTKKRFNEIISILGGNGLKKKKGKK